VNWTSPVKVTPPIVRVAFGASWMFRVCFFGGSASFLGLSSGSDSSLDDNELSLSLLSLSSFFFFFFFLSFFSSTDFVTCLAEVVLLTKWVFVDVEACDLVYGSYG
jgi:hypothetical protein